MTSKKATTNGKRDGAAPIDDFTWEPFENGDGGDNNKAKTAQTCNETLITPELVTRFVLGKTTTKEWFAVSAAMQKHPSVRRMVQLSMELNNKLSGKRPIANPLGQSACKMFAMNHSTLPVDRLAATSKANDCVVRCEQFVLNERGREQQYETLLAQAQTNDWIQEKGMPLYNIGRLLELAAFSVARMFNGSLNTIKDELEAGCSVIVALNAESLSTAKKVENAVANHAVVVLSVDLDNKVVEVYDPQQDPARQTFPAKTFLRSWKASKRFFVSIVERGTRPYTPHPEYVGHIKLPEDIAPAADMLAENAHEIWAKDRLAEAEKKRLNGEEANPDKDPFMKPFMELTPAQRKSDYLTALNTIKLIFKLGFTITRTETVISAYTPNMRTEDGRYIPKPASMDDVSLPKEMEALTEYIAENSHEEWAKLRMKEGWTYAPKNDKKLKQSQDLIPYCELLDSEKDYDRKMAMHTLKVLYKMGFRFKAPENR